MLNGLGETQRVLVLGGKSELALSILEHIPLAEDAELLLFARNLSNFIAPEFLDRISVKRVEIDLTDVETSKMELVKVFATGDIDLVICAYATLGNEELQLESDLFASVLNTNFYSQSILLNEVCSLLAKQMHGQILVISSVAGIRARSRNFVYGASKSGIDFIAQGLQKRSHEKNIFITILRPGFVHTKMTSGLSAAPFAINKKVVAKITADGLRKKKRIIYAPRKLRFVMFVVKMLPESIFRIIDK